MRLIIFPQAGVGATLWVGARPAKVQVVAHRPVGFGWATTAASGGWRMPCCHDRMLVLKLARPSGDRSVGQPWRVQQEAPCEGGCL